MDRPDLLGYLFSEYEKELVTQEYELADEAKKMFESFVEFCRFKLKANPAVALCAIEQGLGLKLSDGGEVALVNMPKPDSNDFGSVPITNPRINPAQHGISSVASHPIFGGDQK